MSGVQSLWNHKQNIHHQTLPHVEHLQHSVNNPTGYPHLFVIPQEKHRGTWPSIRRKGIEYDLITRTGFHTQPSLLLLWPHQFDRPDAGLDICRSLLIPHGMKPNYGKMASLHASLGRYKYLQGPLNIVSLHMKQMWACEVWKCQWIELSDLP